ncbi:MAG: hypothetical protein HY305_03220 [Sphingobacteriales bacterium]|nr:hypothetical protein [Sphingobacteriales bacterium]
MVKIMWSLFVLSIISVSIFIYGKFYFVFGEGTKSGQLNFLVKKGYVFKTYEGKVIQQGFRSKSVGSLESYTFEFSVTDENIARQLMLNSGKNFDLHYKAYLGALPWRGISNYIVDSIITMEPAQ